ncbi:hypothetical protein [Aeromonas hydrophila]|uniref:hypothetical protein n=1 Tax=Aeromonas hydrophila TaxID=644 RepID=UPI0038D12C40
MKEVLLALKDSVEGRLKNHVIASVVIAWFFWNWRGVLTFALSSKTEMIEIIRNYQCDLFGDVLNPVITGLIFITIGQYIIYAPAHFAEIISIRISTFSHKNALKKLAAQKELNKEKISSDYDYQKELMLKGLEDASSQLDSLRKECSLLQGNNKDLAAVNEELRGDISDLESQVVHAKGEVEDRYQKINDALIDLKDSSQYVLGMLDQVYKSDNEIEKTDFIEKARIVVSDALNRMPETRPIKYDRSEAARRSRWVFPALNNTGDE